MPKDRVEDQVIVGIAGDPAAGGTTPCRRLAAILGPNRVAVICRDDLHDCSRAERMLRGFSGLDPPAGPPSASSSSSRRRASAHRPRRPSATTKAAPAEG